MPRVNDADRHALSRARRHMRLARQALPTGGCRGHMVSLLNCFVRSIDEEIGPEEEVEPRDLDAELPDGWHGHHKLDGEPSERELAHVAEPRDHEAERRAAVARIANDPDSPGWDSHEP